MKDIETETSNFRSDQAMFQKSKIDSINNDLDAMEREGFIVGYETVKNEDTSYDHLKVNLKYVHGNPVINEISRVSKPGRRVYSKIKDLQRNFDGLGIYILSTSKGVLSDSEARVESVGGEILCKIF